MGIDRQLEFGYGFLLPKDIEEEDVYSLLKEPVNYLSEERLSPWHLRSNEETLFLVHTNSHNFSLSDDGLAMEFDEVKLTVTPEMEEEANKIYKILSEEFEDIPKPTRCLFYYVW